MTVVGLCGGSGSGKGTLCDVFREFGVPSIDTDAVYHDLTSHSSDCLSDLVAEFGEEIISDGALDRKVLAGIVFGDSSGERLKRLNTIAHAHILAKTREIIDKHGSDGHNMVIVDAPLLFESGFDRECDIVISVFADRKTRIKRIMKRDNMTYSDAERRLNSQKPDEWISAHSDIIITNNGDIQSLHGEVSLVINYINTVFGGKKHERERNFRQAFLQQEERIRGSDT